MKILSLGCKVLQLHICGLLQVFAQGVALETPLEPAVHILLCVALNAPEIKAASEGEEFAGG